MMIESDCITLLTRSQISAAYPGNETAALELETLEASCTVGYTIRSNPLSTAVQEAQSDRFMKECKVIV